MNFKTLISDKHYSYLVTVDGKSIAFNITNELCSMKDIEPLEIFEWFYEDLLTFLEEDADEGEKWEVEYNRDNSIDGWDLALPRLYDSTTLRRI